MSGAPLLPAGYRLCHHAVIGSTNDEAKAMARGGAPGGAFVWADVQTKGRGRRGRAWHSPAGNLYLSLLLRPGGEPAAAAQLGFVAALGLGDALAALAGPELDLRYKWPNDLLAGGRKLAGILLESETGAAGSVDFVVIGIGLNLASAPDGTAYPATSLADAGIAGITPQMAIEGFARYFDDWLQRWHCEGFAPVRAAWLARAAGLGAAIRVRFEHAELTGRFLDLDHDGALVLATGTAGARRVAAGEIFPAA